jgi:hypothetical protein
MTAKCFLLYFIQFLCGCSLLPALAEHQARPEPFRLVDKTLVAWVLPLSRDTGFMGVFCVQENSTFDGLALTGDKDRQWIVWSDFLRRTAKGRNWPKEMETRRNANTPVCIASVYKDDTVSFYCNGEEYLSYKTEPQPFSQFTKVVSGFGHQLPCEVHDLRLYNVALLPEQIRDLKMNADTTPSPLAQWTFKNGSLEDSRHCFQKGELTGDVKVCDGKLVFAGTNGAQFSASLPPDYSHNPKQYQTGFYTAGYKEPDRMGQLWDTWVYYYHGKYYQYFDAGICGFTDQYDLAVSDDGVVWREIGKVLQRRPGVSCLGTGTIIEAPGFEDTNPKWQLNYTETVDGRQSIMFATSSDLIQWNKLGESCRFHPDERWYDPAGRCDCMDYVRMSGGGLYSYYTANPIGKKVAYRACGFGVAESKDGIHWTALPPIPGNIGGEIGGVQKIGNRYFATIGGGEIGVSDSPEGPFLAQKKNTHAFGQDCDVGFPRFFHNPPVEKTLNRNGALMSHFFWGSLVYSALLKAIEIDPEGTFRVMWWEGNNILKQAEKPLSLRNEERSNPAFFQEDFDPEQVGVIEANFKLSSDDLEHSAEGFYFEKTINNGYVVIFSRTETAFGMMNRQTGALAIFARTKPDMDFGATGRVRVIVKKDLMEAYVNDFLVMVKRTYWDGKLGIVGHLNEANDIHAWIHE